MNEPTDAAKAIFKALNQASCEQDLFDAFKDCPTGLLVEIENMIKVVLDLRENKYFADKRVLEGKGKEHLPE